MAAIGPAAAATVAGGGALQWAPPVHHPRRAAAATAGQVAARGEVDHLALVVGQQPFDALAEGGERLRVRRGAHALLLTLGGCSASQAGTWRRSGFAGSVRDDNRALF